MSRSWPWRPSRRSGSSGGGVEKAGFDSFQTLAGTIYDRYDEVLNFFNDRSTNASAEAFNSKVKNFRAALRGVSDVSFFLFRLQKSTPKTQAFTGEPVLAFWDVRREANSLIRQINL